MYAVDYEGHAISVMVGRADQKQSPNGFEVSIVIKYDGEVVGRHVRVIGAESAKDSIAAREQGLALAHRFIDTGEWDK